MSAELVPVDNMAALELIFTEPDVIDGSYSVYRAENATGHTLYIGRTCDVKQRLRQHRQTSQWARYARRIHITCGLSQPLSVVFERMMIQAFQPPFNVQHNPRWGKR